MVSVRILGETLTTHPLQISDPGALYKWVYGRTLRHICSWLILHNSVTSRSQRFTLIDHTLPIMTQAIIAIPNINYFCIYCIINWNASSWWCSFIFAALFTGKLWLTNNIELRSIITYSSTRQLYSYKLREGLQMVVFAIEPKYGEGNIITLPISIHSI